MVTRATLCWFANSGADQVGRALITDIRNDWLYRDVRLRYLTCRPGVTLLPQSAPIDP
jgi:hypothetical protein